MVKIDSLPLKHSFDIPIRFKMIGFSYWILRNELIKIKI